MHVSKEKKIEIMKWLLAKANIVELKSYKSYCINDEHEVVAYYKWQDISEDIPPNRLFVGNTDSYLYYLVDLHIVTTKCRNDIMSKLDVVLDEMLALMKEWNSGITIDPVFEKHLIEKDETLESLAIGYDLDCNGILQEMR